MGQEINLTECMCEFCGQVVQVTEHIMQLAKYNSKLAAQLVCDCKDAKYFQRIYTTTDRGVKMVDNICGKGSENPLEPEVVNILHRGVSEIVKNHMLGISINVSGKEKVELKLGKTGIKCNRTVKRTEVDECMF